MTPMRSKPMTARSLADNLADYMLTRRTPWPDEVAMREAVHVAVGLAFTDALDDTRRIIARQDALEMLTAIEWEYAKGQSFGVGEEDVLRWMADHGWSFSPPEGYSPTMFDDFPGDGGDGRHDDE